MSITVPPVLEDVQKAFAVIKEIARLDPKRIEDIESAIKSFNVLNVTERKKAEEARGLIAQHQALLVATDKAANDLAKDKANFLGEIKAFETDRQSRLDDIAVKGCALQEARVSLDQEFIELETVKKQLKTAQDIAAANIQRALEKEADLLKKEQELQLMAVAFDTREKDVSSSEKKVAGKLAQLRQIAE